MIPANPNGINGNDRGAFWALGNRQAPSAVAIPSGLAFLYLDPRVTTPNVVLGVKSPAGTFYMRPGDVLPLNGRGATLRVWNALKDVFPLSNVDTAPLVGFLGLKAGTAEELPSIVATKGTAPHPRAQLLSAGAVNSGSSFQIPTANLTGLRIVVLPMNVAGHVIAAPADFAAVITLATQSAFAMQEPTIVDANGWDPAPVAALEEQLPALYGFTAPSSDNALVAAQNQLGWDRAIVVPSLFMTLTPSGIAGLGVNAARLFLAVEGR